MFLLQLSNINHLEYFGTICITPILLPTACGLDSRERLLAKRRLAAQVTAALIVMLLLFLLVMTLLLLLLLLLRHLQ